MKYSNVVVVVVVVVAVVDGESKTRSPRARGHLLTRVACRRWSPGFCLLCKK